VYIEPSDCVVVFVFYQKVLFRQFILNLMVARGSLLSWVYKMVLW